LIHIILTILKVIGIILLIILGLLLLLLLSVLLLPLKYGGKIQYDENNLYAVIKGRYFFGLLRFKAEFKDKKLKYYVKILWKELLGSNKNNDLSDDKTKSEKVLKSESEKVSEDKPKDETEDELVNEPKGTITEELKEKSSSDLLVIQEEKADDVEDSETHADKNISKWKSIKAKITSIPSKLLGIKEKILSFKDNIIFKIHSFCDKLRGINTKKSEILDYIQQEDTKKFLRLLRHQIYLLFKHILPYKVKGKVRFGLDSPDKTGQALGVMSVVKARYGKKIDIIPDFNQKIIEVNLKYKGRIRVLNLLLIAFKVIIQKKLKEIIKIVKK
jgi:hypothetical protein